MTHSVTNIIFKYQGSFYVDDVRKDPDMATEEISNFFNGSAELLDCTVNADGEEEVVFLVEVNRGEASPDSVKPITDIFFCGEGVQVGQTKKGRTEVTVSRAPVPLGRDLSLSVCE